MLWLALVCMVASAPQDTVKDPARAGWEAIERGDGDAAAAAFRQVLVTRPGDSQALTGAGLAAHLQGRDDQALSALQRAVQANPGNAAASFYLGQIAYAQGNLDLAIASFERVLKISPGSREVQRQLEAWRKEAALHSTFAARPTARFTVMFEGPAQEAIAARVSAVLERAYAAVGKTLKTYPSETVTAILYTKQQFRDVTKSPAWAAAAYDGRIRIPVLGALKAPSELDRVVTHEFVHAVIHQMYPGTPAWLHEGLATYLEPVDHAWLTARLTKENLIPFAQLDEAFHTADGEEALIAYAESYALTRAIAERLGPNLPTFLGYVSGGTPADQALAMFNVKASDLKLTLPSTPGPRPKR